MSTDTNRFERKFSVPSIDDRQVREFLNFSSARFKETYPKRKINNIYFDTPEFTFLKNHIEGLDNRFKFRLRWYGDQYTEVIPQFEIKSKNSNLVNKTHWILDKTSLDEISDPRTCLNYLLSSSLPSHTKEKLKMLRPTLCNSYYREYYTSSFGLIRATVDKDIYFKHPLFRFGIDSKNICIFELKYGHSNKESVQAIVNDIPFRFSKFSKYVRGIQVLEGGSIEQN